MARQKPNKTSKPPQQDTQSNTDPLTNITPQSATAPRKQQTPSNNRKIPKQNNFAPPYRPYSSTEIQ
jgi:hypothetical protein